MIDMRLIDADALMPFFVQKAYEIQDRHGVKLGEKWLLNYDEIKEVIDSAPTVNPSLNLDNITEEDIEKFKMIWMRATSKGLSLIFEDSLTNDPKSSGSEDK